MVCTQGLRGSRRNILEPSRLLDIIQLHGPFGWGRLCKRCFIASHFGVFFEGRTNQAFLAQIILTMRGNTKVLMIAVAISMSCMITTIIIRILLA